LFLFACGEDEGGRFGDREVLLSPQANQLDVYDLETDEKTVLIAAEDNTVNGQVCALPDGSGRFLLGEDTGQETGARQGWGIFSPEGELQDKILEPETPNEPEQVEPYGCGFDAEGRLFTSDIGDTGFDSTNGKLIVFFPPDYDSACVLDANIRVAGAIAVDDDGSVLITESVPPGRVLRFSPPFPAGEDECDSVTPEKTTFIEDPDMGTPLGIVRAPNGNWYVSSVFVPTTIREYDATGAFVRTIAEGGDIGSPAGLAVDSNGTLYYADLAIEVSGDDIGPADGEGTVRRIRFDENGKPLPPEVIGSGLDYPDAVAVLTLP
jgi:sugar lactone lactonase YvrE